MPDRERAGEGFTYIGRRVARSDAGAKVTGAAVYLDDIKLAGMLYGKVLRSRHPHAIITGIDTSGAERLPGVKCVATGADLPFLHGESLVDEPFLARGKVRYLGEGVAAVAAVDEETAEAALGLIEVRYQELPALFDPVEAARPGVLIHDDVDGYARSPGINPVRGTNICNHFQLERGDVERGFAESDRIFEDTFTTQVQQHATIEPHGAICRIDGESNVTLWTNNDSPYRCRREIAGALGVPLSRVRIISADYVGGNFGGKGGLKAEACAIALAWKVRNRPVKVMYSREEEFLSSIVRHPVVVRMKTGVKKDGSILARQVECYWATGAYAEKGPTVSMMGSLSAAGPYKIPNVSINSYAVYTNTQVAGAMRGYGGPQVAWAYESQMDIIAAELALDPLEIRLKNAYSEGDEHVTGHRLHAEGLKECLSRVAEAMEWGVKKPGRDRGRGIACMERAVKTPFGSAAFVKVNEDGTVDVLSSTTEVGQGSETVLCQIAAEELGVPLEWVRKAAPDTAFTPYDASTTSSRSTFHMGNAVKMAAADAREQILRLAAEVLKAGAGDLELRGGEIRVSSDPKRSVDISGVLRAHYGGNGAILGRGYYIPRMPSGPVEYYSSFIIFWLLGAHGVEVEVDRATGEVRILKVYAAHDSGKAINPDGCIGQIQGGVAMGLGQALYEELVIRGGRALNPSLLDYAIPSARDIPEIVPILVESPHRDGPFGAKGVGETTNVPLPPAIANAIYSAVGVRIRDLPVTPEKILAGLRAKGRKKA